MPILFWERFYPMSLQILVHLCKRRGQEINMKGGRNGKEKRMVKRRHTAQVWTGGERSMERGAPKKLEDRILLLFQPHAIPSPTWSLHTHTYTLLSLHTPFHPMLLSIQIKHQITLGPFSDFLGYGPHTIFSWLFFEPGFSLFTFVNNCNICEGYLLLENFLKVGS